MKYALLVAVTILAILAVSIFMVFWLKEGKLAPLAFATVAAGVLTFYQFISSTDTTGNAGASKDGRLRSAIAAALVVQYLVLVGVVAYFNNTDALTNKLAPITEKLLASFTATIGVVIAFYFGASAYVDGKRIESETRISNTSDSAVSKKGDA